jgi:hypothetical protein
VDMVDKRVIHDLCRMQQDGVRLLYLSVACNLKHEFLFLEISISYFLTSLAVHN